MRSNQDPYEPDGEFGPVHFDSGEMWVRPNPQLTAIDDVFGYALTVDGYGYAKKVLGMECADLANSRSADHSRSGTWEGTFTELRCCLFYEQRRWRHFGYNPEGESLEAILALHRTICNRWEQEAGGTRER